MCDLISIYRFENVKYISWRKELIDKFTILFFSSTKSRKWFKWLVVKWYFNWVAITWYCIRLCAWLDVSSSVTVILHFTAYAFVSIHSTMHTMRMIHIDNDRTALFSRVQICPSVKAGIYPYGVCCGFYFHALLKQLRSHYGH